MTTEIRVLEPDEVDRVVAVLGLSRLHQGDGFYLVAWRSEEPLGHAHLALTDPPELQDVSVRPEHRRRGVASALTAAAERSPPSAASACSGRGSAPGTRPLEALDRGLGDADAGAPRGGCWAPSCFAPARSRSTTRC